MEPSVLFWILYHVLAAVGSVTVKVGVTVVPSQVFKGAFITILDWQTFMEISSSPRSLPDATAVELTTWRSTWSVVATNEPPTCTQPTPIAMRPDLPMVSVPFTTKEISGDEALVPVPGIILIHM